MKVSYTWLQSYFDTPLPSPEKIEEALSFHSFEPEGIEQVANDTMLDFDVLPNRAHDALCHRGIAGEISTVMNIDLNDFENRYPTNTTNESASAPQVSINEPDKCTAYLARTISNITIGPSPQWLKDQLKVIGQRSINNVVDATNYVMFDIGQPLHAFDAGKVTDQSIIIRNATDNEQITLLTGEEKTLRTSDLVIADTEKPLAIAGVKGGNSAEVDNATTSIILEAAHFNPQSTRATARHHKIFTDSSKRFENEIHPSLAKEAMDLVTRLIVDIAGTDSTAVSSVTQAGNISEEKPQPITLSLSRINTTLGTDYSHQEVSETLDRLRFDHSYDDNVFTITPPITRLDLTIPAEMIEEIGRIAGYNTIPNQLLTTQAGEHAADFRLISVIQNLLHDHGYQEVQTYNFVKKGKIKVLHALASDKSYARKNLNNLGLKNLEKNLRNAELLGTDTVKQFEIGRVFPGGTNEQLHLFVAETSQQKKYKHNLDVIESALVELLGTKPEAIHSDHQSREYDLTPFIDKAMTFNPSFTWQPHSGQFSAISNFPFMLRDIAVWVPTGTSTTDLEQTIIEHSGKLLARTPRKFDNFEKDGRVSYAYRIVFQAHDRTLTDEEVNVIMDTITQACTKNGWEVR